jgi:hypothetical protein
MDKHIPICMSFKATGLKSEMLKIIKKNKQVIVPSRIEEIKLETPTSSAASSTSFAASNESLLLHFRVTCRSKDTNWIRKKLREAGGDPNLAAVDVAAAAEGRKRKTAETPKVPKSPKIPIASGRKLRDRAVSEDGE